MKIIKEAEAKAKVGLILKDICLDYCIQAEEDSSQETSSSEKANKEPTQTTNSSVSKSDKTDSKINEVRSLNSEPNKNISRTNGFRLPSPKPRESDNKDLKVNEPLPSNSEQTTKNFETNGFLTSNFEPEKNDFHTKKSEPDKIDSEIFNSYKSNLETEFQTNEPLIESPKRSILKEKSFEASDSLASSPEPQNKTDRFRESSSESIKSDISIPKGILVNSKLSKDFTFFSL